VDKHLPQFRQMCSFSVLNNSVLGERKFL
jgi:hypothetical protein